jgi:hypothetical protein
MRRLLAITSVLALVAVAPALGANPHGPPGQPNQSCETSSAEPPGFTNSAGFENAESHYAGAENSPTFGGNPHAVSQYDEACFQVSQH